MSFKMRRMLFFALLSLTPTTVLAFGDSPCYFANGTQTNSDEIKQCSNGVTTTCCKLNRQNTPGGETTIGGWTQEECLSNGLCQNRLKTNGVAHNTWWVEYCTNPDPTSSDCLDVCRSTRDAMGGSRMTPCGESGDGSYNAVDDDRETTRWCCGDSDSCCTNNIGVVVLPRNFTGSAITSSVSSSATSSTSSATSPTSPTSTSETSPASPTSSTSSTTTESNISETGSTGLSTGAKAGIGAGAAVGIVAIVLAAFFGHKAYGYRKMAKGRQIEDTQGLDDYSAERKQIYAGSGYGPTELTATLAPAELPSPDRASELPASLGHHARD